MANRQEHRPYLELGQMLEAWRRSQFRSALAMFKAAKFTFSYAAYADFERGVSLTSIEALLELAQYFKQPAGPAAMLWAKLQMPTRELQELFIFERRKKPRPPAKTEAEGPAPNFENTWVFGPRERALLTKAPWFWEVCMVLNSAFPEAVPISELPFPDAIDAE